jgi:hypothetical protein
MFVDVEETLGRELREVAEGLQVPVMPPLADETARSPRHWQPLLVAAVVVLFVAGAVAVVATTRGGQEVQPAPPSPSPTEPVVRIATTPPTVPYVLDQRLYVDGARVPGSWWSVQAGDAGWVALRTDNTWWWGSGPEANKIESPLDLPPVISPNGKYVAMVADDNGHAFATGFDTRPGGEGMGGVPVYPGDAAAGDPVRVRAVTDDGRVIVQGSGTDFLWLPLGDNTTVDLNSTAPGQQVLDNTPAGLVVTDGDGGEPYLAEISDTGDLTRIGELPAHSDLRASPGAAWLAWTPEGSEGGEVTSLSALEAQTMDGSQQATLSAPAGWGFRVQAWVWEDDDHLVSPVIRDGSDGNDGGERMVRCSVQSARCVLIDAH